MPASFEHRVVTIPAGGARAYEAGEWRDAIVVVDRGEVELEALDGERHRFGCGALVWLDGVHAAVDPQRPARGGGAGRRVPATRP